MAKNEGDYLKMRISGRIIDHLGLQMYQSPVAAIAELISNSWDADAENVWISLPDSLGEEAVIVIKDDGIGMTKEECEKLYLEVGRRRREKNPNEISRKYKRPVLGRKGIGKFAGFGIARTIRLETSSEETGERTIFELDIKKLRGDKYVSSKGIKIPILEYEKGDEKRKKKHGTQITLANLNFDRRINVNQFAKSMARRFLLHKRVANFKIFVNEKEIPEAEDLEKIEFIFPRDYEKAERPEGIGEENGWGVENLTNSETIKWRIVFYEDTIDEEELQGVSIFAKDKLAQKPFFFNLAGGLGGQHGQAYMSGRILADYVDSSAEDLIATERQRINWDQEETIPLETWGKDKVKELLKIWHDRRGEKRRLQIEKRLTGFSERLENLPTTERKTVRRALNKIGSIDTLKDKQFEELGEALLTAWEQGRLRELISDISSIGSMTESDLLEVLGEANILTALNTAEAVKTKLLAIGGLKQRLEKQELERAVRDYIAENPWLIAPIWETFKIERTVRKLLEDAVAEAGMTGPDWEGRIDLALSSGHHLLLLEFMRPGLTIDWDHINRFDRYYRIIDGNIKASTGGAFNTVTGYLTADNLVRDSSLLERIKSMKRENMFVWDWRTLLGNAISGWTEFLEILVSRAPDDERLSTLLELYDQ